jgi:type II secretory pathway component GspD/PulD (secretin)
MKTKLAILLAAGLPLLGILSQAQTQGAEAAKPAAGAAAAPAVADEPSDVTFEDTPLLTVIKTLAQQAGLNIIFDPKVEAAAAEPDPKAPKGAPSGFPPVSIKLKNVTAHAALDSVLDNYGLAMQIDAKNNIHKIKLKDPTVLEPLVTKIYQLKYANPSNLVQVVKATLTTRSQVLADGRTSQLVILATEHEFEAVESLVERLDAPTRQVLIEARIYESSKSPSSLKGIDWSGTLQGQNFTFGNGRQTGTTTQTQPGTPVSTTTTLPDGRTITTTTTPNSSQQTTLTTLLGGGGLAANTMNGLSPGIGFLNADGVKGALSFLNKDSDTELLATPRAVTLDNIQATLAVTRAFPIFQQSPGSANTPATTTIIYTNVGTILTVTPRIAANSNILLKVVPEVSNIDSKDSQVINGQVNQANVYASRRIEAQVMIPSGNTLVMGGLISDTTTKGWTKIPVLGDLPGPLGLPFRHDSKQRLKQNLVMFITPTIVQDFDFQYNTTDFLRSPVPEKSETEESAWNSGRPKSWGSGTK